MKETEKKEKKHAIKKTHIYTIFLRITFFFKYIYKMDPGDWRIAYVMGSSDTYKSINKASSDEDVDRCINNFLREYAKRDVILSHKELVIARKVTRQLTNQHTPFSNMKTNGVDTNNTKITFNPNTKPHESDMFFLCVYSSKCIIKNNTNNNPTNIVEAINDDFTKNALFTTFNPDTLVAEFNLDLPGDSDCLVWFVIYKTTTNGGYDVVSHTCIKGSTMMSASTVTADAVCGPVNETFSCDSEPGISTCGSLILKNIEISDRSEVFATAVDQRVMVVEYVGDVSALNAYIAAAFDTLINTRHSVSGASQTACILSQHTPFVWSPYSVYMAAPSRKIRSQVFGDVYRFALNQMPIETNDAAAILKKAVEDSWNMTPEEDDDFAELVSLFCAPYRYIVYHSDKRCNKQMEFMSNGATMLCGDCEDSAIANCQFITSFLDHTELEKDSVLYNLQQAIKSNYEHGLSAMYLEKNTGHMVAVLVPIREGPRLLVIEGTFRFSNRKKEKSSQEIDYITTTCAKNQLWTNHVHTNFESIALAKDKGIIRQFNKPFSVTYTLQDTVPIDCTEAALSAIQKLADALIPIPELHTVAQTAYETPQDTALKQTQSNFVKTANTKTVGNNRIDYVSFVFNVADRKKLKHAEDFLKNIENINNKSQEFELVVSAEECNIIPHLYTVMLKIYANEKTK